MTNESESRGSGSAGKREETGNARTQTKEPIGGGAVSRGEERSGRADSKGNASQQSNADAEGPSRQTSTAEDEQGQL